MLKIVIAKIEVAVRKNDCKYYMTFCKRHLFIKLLLLIKKICKTNTQKAYNILNFNPKEILETWVLEN